MSFPGQLLQLQIVERLTSTDEILSFLRISNNANTALRTAWRLYFSLGLAPTEDETRVSRTIVEGRYGYLEPTAEWRSLRPGHNIEIPIKNWLFTHMPALARQGFHLLSWQTSPEEGSLSLPECLPPALLDIESVPNKGIRDLSPSCDVTPDSAQYRYKTNASAYGNKHFTIIPAPDRLAITGDRFKFKAFDFSNNELIKVLPKAKTAGGLPVNVNYIPNQRGYTLDVTEKGIDITSDSEQSTYHAAHTLRQLINDDGLLPCQVSDKADFRHRGLFVDIARHFHGVSDLKTIIQTMASYKMNRLQLGISNDEGWRLEIPGLEELTNVGSRRKFSTNVSSPIQALHPSWGDGPEERYDFISGDQFVDLLQFADHHHIEVIIEFNLPGHANALIRSIEASGRYQIVDPQDRSTHVSAQGYTHNIVNVCLPDTFELARVILSAIADYYKAARLKLKHVHLGGDEVPKGAWLNSPVCQKSPIWQSGWNLDSKEDRQAAALALQKHYVQRIIETVHSIDPCIKVGFWHEMSNAIPKAANIYITGWTTERPPSGLIDRILDRKQDLVISNASFLYLDMPYSLHADEPGLPWAAYVSTQRIHDFSPLACWRIEDAKNVVGLQAQLWTETVLDQSGLHYYLFPRLLAVADRAWCRKPGNWASFAGALGSRELAYLESLKIAYRLPPPGVKITGNRLQANVAYPGLTIRYNINGENPSANCPIVTSEIDITNIKEIRLATFSPSGERSSRVEIIENLINTNVD